MDAMLPSIVAGVIANGLTAVVGHLTGSGREISKIQRDLSQILQNHEPLTRLLQRATASTARSTEFDQNQLTDQIHIFLASPEVDAIARQIYSTRLTVKPNGHLESIRAEFLAFLSLRLGQPGENVKRLADDLFNALVDGCEKALAVAVDKGILSAHEAKSALRHSMILDELATIRKNLTLLTATDKPNIESVLEFEEKYRKLVGDRHGYITPPNFDAARKLCIDDIYVAPDFVRRLKEKGREPERLKIQEFLGVIYRAVLLGNPGGGKSTFAVKLCHDLATNYSERIIAGRQLSPILVILRDYGAEKKARNCSILQFIELTANSKYQIQPPRGAFEYLLLSGRALVILDGLDELLETSYRQEVSGDVETFCNLYPAVPVLVTSREVGYEQAPLDENKFETFRVSPFNDEQVRQYAKKSFGTDPDLIADQQKQKAEAFLRESQIVPDLRSNPLMLALMCNIYRGENYIPRNRPDVYEKCAVMLFERWDKSRGIHTTLPIEAHIRPAMMYLAHWIYTEEILQGGVTEKNLIAKATEDLCPRRFEDRDEAESAAREFIEFCRGRAWVFTDTGTTREGERLYQFTHRTFLEYFTAAHLVRTNPTPEKLGDILAPRIAKREWDVIAQLAFQLQNKNVEGAGDQLLAALLDLAKNATGNKVWNLLAFAARCLEFMVPSPKVTRSVALACFNQCINWLLTSLKKDESPYKVFDRRRSRGRAEPAEILGSLLSVASENRNLISVSMEKFLVERINSTKELESLAAVNMVFPLQFTLRIGRADSAPNSDLHDYWETFSKRILTTCWDRLQQLCRKYFDASYDSLLLDKVTIARVVEWHGIGALFQPCGYPTAGIVIPAIAEIIMIAVDTYPHNLGWLTTDFTTFRQQLRDLGMIFLSSSTPWLTPKAGELRSSWLFHRMRFTEFEGNRERLDLDGDELFALFCLTAVYLEVIKEGQDLPAVIKRSDLRACQHLRSTLLARFEHVEGSTVETEMDSCRFSPKQRDLVSRWTHGEIKFVQAPNR